MKIYLLAAAIAILTALTANTYADEVYVWYGNHHGSPINAEIGELVDIDIYIQTPGIVVADMHLCLGAENLYIDRMLSELYGEFYPPYDTLLDYVFTPQFGSPPNPSGWSSQSVLLWTSSNWNYFDTTTPVLKMVCRIVDDSLLIGETIPCLGAGHSPSGAGDTLGGEGYPVIESYSPIHFIDTTTSISNHTEFMPDKFVLGQNYPNPFNNFTTIRYYLPNTSKVTLNIYDILGRKIETLFKEEQKPGFYQFIWNADGKPSGMYFYRIKANDKTETKKMLLLK